ncbi:FGGY-family carbohydrate kinase [Volucribacter amazonae]|uniref:Carbohydrate kinase n=1 Tax=Volucribacter amazonae TaxID=256731 RepID=A0A9X4SKD2_9PAST|nr:carbohydrate kinase [Volucribacter amazonae]MDG6895019.1 carbohydrate kinase [Volucribacter amazonae]
MVKSNEQYWLGIDCGGTFIKAGLYDAQFNEIHCVRQSLTIISSQAGWAERNLTDLWLVCVAVIKEVVQQSQLNPQDIKGIGISAQGKGLFLLDKQQQPLGNGILSSDQRALEIVKQWQQEGIPQQLYPQTRQTLWTGHPVAILRWLKQHQPGRYQNIGAVLMSHDYLRFCLTGQIAAEETNISESNLYNMQTGQYDESLAQLLDIAEIMPALPPIIQSADIAGYILPEVALQTGLAIGTPVVGGLFDVVSTALCANLTDEYTLNAVLGTWSVVSGITDHIQSQQTIPFVYGRYAIQNQFIVHEASPTSAANLEWVCQQLNIQDYQRINQLVSELPKAKSAVFFVPFLYGSNAGLGMQAGFYGLQSIHNQAHLLQAVYEGVMFSLMYHLQRMLERFPQTHTIRVTGGPAKSKVWLQILADLTGIKIEVPQIEETGCLGAAMVACQGVSQRPLTNAIKPKVIEIQPDPQAYSLYQQKYQKYQLLVRCLQTFNEQQHHFNLE